MRVDTWPNPNVSPFYVALENIPLIDQFPIKPSFWFEDFPLLCYLPGGYGSVGTPGIRVRWIKMEVS